MPTFTFRLEAVLGFKKRIEDNRKRELAELKELLVREEKFLQVLEEKRKGQQERLKNSQVNVLNMDDILDYYNYLTGIREKIVSQIAYIEQLIQAVEKKREDLITASKERKIIEKLKEQQYREFRETVEKWETKFLDEMATNGYTHKKERR